MSGHGRRDAPRDPPQPCWVCRRPVLYARTDKNSKRLLLDPEPDPKGNQAAFADPNGTWHTRQLSDNSEPPGSWEQVYMPHIATCPGLPPSERPPAPQVLPQNVTPITAAPSWRGNPLKNRTPGRRLRRPRKDTPNMRRPILAIGSGLVIAAALAGCRGSGTGATAAQSSAVATAEADAIAYFGPCWPTAATGQLKLIASLDKQSGREALMACAGVPKGDRQAAEACAANNAEHAGKLPKGVEAKALALLADAYPCAKQYRAGGATPAPVASKS